MTFLNNLWAKIRAWIIKIDSWPTPKYPERTREELATKFGKDVVAFSLWMEKNIWYSDHVKEWQTPEKILKTGVTGCAGFAILSFWVLKEMGAKDVKCLWLTFTNGKEHMITVFKGFEIDRWMWFSNGELHTGWPTSTLQSIAEDAAKSCYKHFDYEEGGLSGGAELKEWKEIFH